jgi:CheY-like chemotaxis protein
MSNKSMPGLFAAFRRRFGFRTPPLPDPAQPVGDNWVEVPLDESNNEEAFDSVMPEPTDDADVGARPDESRNTEPPRSVMPEPVLRKGAEQPLRILVAECDPAQSMIAWLEEQGHSVSLVQDGQSALDALERELFDAALIAIQIPVKNGYEVTRTIRERERKGACLHVPMIALIADPMKVDREICLEAGFDDCLPKPVRTQGLESMLNSLPSGVFRRAECA